MPNGLLRVSECLVHRRPMSGAAARLSPVSTVRLPSARLRRFPITSWFRSSVPPILRSPTLNFIVARLPRLPVALSPATLGAILRRRESLGDARANHPPSRRTSFSLSRVHFRSPDYELKLHPTQCKRVPGARLILPRGARARIALYTRCTQIVGRIN